MFVVVRTLVVDFAFLSQEEKPKKKKKEKSEAQWTEEMGVGRMRIVGWLDPRIGWFASYSRIR